jgi:hypothetical protein
MASPSYRQSRTLVLVTGSAVLLATAGVLLLRAQDPTEVLAVVLFLPVFVAAVLGGVRWGLAVAVLAGVAYIGLRLPDIRQFGWSLLGTRIAAQFIGYLAFGALGGWAAGVVGAGITKLDRFDVRDDDSELLNARGLHEQLGDELARAQRYGSSFSVVTVTFALSGDKREVRQRIGTVVRESVRTVDETGRVTIDDKDVVIAVLPETPREGAEVAGTKIGERLETEATNVDADVQWLSHPEDEAEIEQLQQRLDEVVQREHPEAASRS